MEAAIPLEDDEPEDTSVWAASREMLAAMLQCFGLPQAISAIGLGRRSAGMLTRWLWSTEAAVRRLLLAAALRIEVVLAKPARRANASTSAQPAEPAGAPSTEPKLHGHFRIFSIRRRKREPRPGILVIDDRFLAQTRQARPKPAPKPPAQPTPNPALGTLPLDPLLCIGASTLAPRKRETRRRIYIRKGRLSRWDPENLFEGRDRQSYDDWLLHGPWKHHDHSFTLPAPPPPQREIHFPGHRPIISPRPDPLLDQTLRPAPNLAARILGLARVLEKPEAAALRLARQIARSKDLRQRLPLVDAPVYTRRKGDKLPSPPDGGIAEAHAALVAALVPPDTS